MTSTRAKIWGNFRDFIVSKWFFRTILLLFIAEASWLAITSAYPMAFDEDYHFGLIQFFSHHLLNPLVSNQPSSTYYLGNIPHDPSWLYHYLLAFPYVLISHLTNSLKLQIIALRLINVAMVTGGIVLARKLFRQMGLHRGVSNVAVCLFAFTPVVTVLAAQINYDNMLILGSVWALYLTVRSIQQIRSRQPDVKTLLLLLAVCCFTSLAKYSFLPIFVAIVLLLAWFVGRQLFDRSFNHRALKLSFQSMHIGWKISLTSVAFVGFVLFSVSYGGNLLKYGNPVPQCNQVLSVADCHNYGSWDRNYTIAQQYQHAPRTMSPLYYTYVWARTSWYQLYGDLIPGGGVVPIGNAFLTGLIGLSLFAFFATLSQLKKLFRDYPALLITTFSMLLYVLFLWSRNYHDYLDIGQPVAIQGRYLVPVLLYYYAVLIMGLRYALQRGAHPLFRAVEMLTATAAVFLFIGYGGYVRYLSQVSPQYTWRVSAEPIAAKSLITH